MSRLAERRARMLDAKYRQFGEAATWTPADGSPPLEGVSVRPRSGDEEGRFGDGRLIGLSVILEVRRSEVATPAQEDQVALAEGGDAFVIIAEPQLTPLGLEWLCEARRV